MDYTISSNRILVIDDSRDIHEDFRKVLKSPEKGLKELKQSLFNEPQVQIEWPVYEIEAAYQGEEGFFYVKKALEENKPYFLVFVDTRMPPGWDGVETIQRIWEVDPDIQVVICTAYSDYTWPAMVGKLGISDRLLILKKPFDSIEVRQLASALNQKWQLLRESRHRLELLQSRVEERTAEIKATLEATADGILVVSHQSKIINYNQNFLKMWQGLTWSGKTIESILEHKNPSELNLFISFNLVEEKHFSFTLEDLMHHFNEESFTESRLEFHLKNGKFLELYTKPLLKDREIIGRVLSFRDISERKKFEEQLAFQATHDLVTNLPNRMLLVDRLQQAILQAKRLNIHIAVMFLDIDRFKVVNDSLGHDFGDELLKAIAERLRLCMREADTLCRVGGDEFVMIIPGLKDEHRFAGAVQKIQNALKKPFVLNNHQLSITGSIGISIYPKNGQDANELLKNADGAMYRAKAAGKNTFQFYEEEMNAQIRERLDLEQSLYQAFTLGEFLLEYQPLINVKTKEIVGTEALLRWKHPSLGFVPPKKFIAIAEETGLILPISEWVLRTACEQNMRWQKRGLPVIPISVNLSGYQTKHHNAVKMVGNVLDELNYEGKYLELELTENILMESTDEVKAVFRSLQERGVAFVIDDFGTGYSNLSYLMHYPITKLKIDKSFIDNIHQDPIDVIIIQAIISMAHTLNMKVVAEGVETELQTHFLEKNHCDEIQGFYFSKPVSADAYEKLLEGQVLSLQEHKKLLK